MASKGKIALLPPNRLGDGLLNMVVAYNLKRCNYEVTTFNNFMFDMQSWFPEQHINSYPDFNENININFHDYDSVISFYSSPLQEKLQGLGDKYHLFCGKKFDRSKTILWNMLDICREFFNIPAPEDCNGIKSPGELQHRKFSSRIVIHPTSTNDKKNWPAKKFLILAEELQEKNFEPVFIVGPHERDHWVKIIDDKYQLPLFPTCDSLARFIYESGYMIGNDSGVGHLASNLGLPTLSLFGRKSVAKLWRPAWGVGGVIVPFQLPGASLQMRYWTHFVSVKKVLKMFEKNLTMGLVQKL